MDKIRFDGAEGFFSCDYKERLKRKSYEVRKRFSVI